MSVIVRALYAGGKKFEAPMRAAGDAALRLLKKRNRDIDIVLVDAGFYKRYTRDAARYERTDLLTPLHADGFNVLSFPSHDHKSMGEVWLCPAYITRHKENLLALLIHGILHCAGYDHIRRRDRIDMEARERTAYASILALRSSRISLLLPKREV